MPDIANTASFIANSAALNYDLKKCKKGRAIGLCLFLIIKESIL